MNMVIVMPNLLGHLHNYPTVGYYVVSQTCTLPTPKYLSTFLLHQHFETQHQGLHVEMCTQKNAVYVLFATNFIASHIYTTTVPLVII